MSTPTPPPTTGQQGGRGTVHGDLSQMASPTWRSGLLYYLILLVAAGIDIATFYQVLALVMRDVPDAVVWLGVVGFTVTALGLAHTMGVRARERIDNGGRALGSPSVLLLLAIWLAVGVTAFIIRLTATPAATSAGTAIVLDGQPITLPGTGAGTRPLNAALLFFALYLATGTFAAIAGYLRHNNAAKQYALTLQARADLAKSVASSAADLALAQQTKVALEEERRRREEGWIKAQEEWQAIARRLKQEARLRLAAHAQNPSTTDAYFEPPEYLRRPTSGAALTSGPAPVSGPGVPARRPAAPPAAPYGAGAAPQAYGTPAQPYGAVPGAYGQPVTGHDGGYTTAIPGVAEQQAWRPNPAAGAHRPAVDHGGTPGAERWESGR